MLADAAFLPFLPVSFLLFSSPVSFGHAARSADRGADGACGHPSARRPPEGGPAVAQGCRPYLPGHPEKGEKTRERSGPAIFAETVFFLFGAVLPGWATVRVRHREPVVPEAGRTASAAVAAVGALAAPAPGCAVLHAVPRMRVRTVASPRFP
ncbi:hypothetical protein GCM10009549_46740 [Streptomyces thermoalcalitolerans]|uniref:Secreted protein n=1 Tax=Streptomyces thermoalcalitolerans TaxID=65605 RepID=A0ABN1PB76_9ACTN